MKHLKPISKAQTAPTTTDIISLITTIVTAIIPIVSFIIEATAPKKQPAQV